MCPIKELAKQRGNYLQIYFQPKQNLDHITMDFRVIAATTLNKEMEILKFRMDACKLKQFQGKNPLVTSIFKSLLKEQNFPQKCPLKSVYTVLLS